MDAATACSITYDSTDQPVVRVDRLQGGWSLIYPPQGTPLIVAAAEEVLHRVGHFAGVCTRDLPAFGKWEPTPALETVRIPACMVARVYGGFMVSGGDSSPAVAAFTPLDVLVRAAGFIGLKRQGSAARLDVRESAGVWTWTVRDAGGVTRLEASLPKLTRDAAVADFRETLAAAMMAASCVSDDTSSAATY